MPFVVNRGQQIHYTVDGEGPLVVLQHGLLSSARGWRENGVVAALARDFQVACVDALGHGQSDKPTDAALYAQPQRAADIVAVIDALGAHRARVAGYSMGGWTAVGVAKYFPGRMAGLAIGGWDLVNGVATAQPPAMARPLTFDDLLRTARRLAPVLTDWITPEAEPGLRACWDAVGDLEGASEAVLAAPCRVMLWDGREDPYHDPMQAYALEHGLRFLSIGGDHLGAMVAHGAEVGAALADFFKASDG